MPLSTIPIGDLEAFFTAMETASFTATAKRLDVNKNVVSQKIRRLEKELGVSLFVRTTRAVVPTDEGSVLYSECEPLVRQLNVALEGIKGKNRLQGPLRITAPADYADIILAPALVEFGQLHPEIEVILITDSKVVDLVRENIHLGVRLGWPKDSTLRGIKVGEFDLCVVASEGYLQHKNSIPQRPRELMQHSWIEFLALENGLSWRFTHTDGAVESVRAIAKFGASTMEGVLSLVRSGGGITVATDFSVAEDLAQNRLTKILSDWHLPKAGIYLVWPPSVQESRRLRTCIDFLRARLETTS